MRWHWPYRWMQLWHPDSPGVRVVVQVRWPRYLWVKGLDQHGRPRSFATIGEVDRLYQSSPDEYFGARY